MKLYKRHGIKPIELKGFLGNLLQAPVFMGIFSAIQRGATGTVFLDS